MELDVVVDEVEVLRVVDVELDVLKLVVVELVDVVID